MNNVILFAGTTEGRKIAEACRGKDLTLFVSVATEYGEAMIPPAENVRVTHGRKDASEMAEMIRTTEAELVIDATHPYAEEVTKTLRSVCKETGTAYLRVVRREEHEGTEDCVFVAGNEEAAAFLDAAEGNVLLTVGSKELPVYAKIRGAEERLFARILPLPDALNSALSLGLKGRNLILMQGPFSEEMNVATLRAVNARYLVTKDTGAPGGFPEKIRAARRLGVTPVVIRRPAAEDGLSVSECLSLLGERFGFRPETKKTVTVLGIGAGSGGSMTRDAEQACLSADLIVGAKRVTDALARFGKETVNAILPKDIRAAVDGSAAKRIVIAMSGDSGFYSGTKKLLPLLSDLEYTVLPGISSVSAFAAKAGFSWDDALLLSAHGRECNFVQKIRRNPKVLILAGGENGVKDMLRTLTEYGLGEVRVTVGENISYENERITKGTAAELSEKTFDPLALVLVENGNAGAEVLSGGRPDTDFLRTEVPMTKQEIRAVTLSKLRLRKEGVLWDVGAGTGSVSLEMAEFCEDGVVYAIERKEEACALIEENKRHLGVSNVRVVCGKAPEALRDLPAPDRVFIGGSSGGLSEILRTALEKNPHARIVLNTVTAETFAEAVAAVKALPVKDTEFTEVSTARSRKVGGYHMMTAQNPVYVISFEGGADA